MRNVIHFVFLTKWFGFCLLLLFFVVSCKTLDKPVEFVDSLRSPTSFPDLFFPTVKDIDAIIQENGLLESETVKITPVGKNKSASIHVVQIQKDAEMGFYSHKLHDELVYVHKGSGIVELNDTATTWKRYSDCDTQEELAQADEHWRGISCYAFFFSPHLIMKISGF
ncbi:MAG: hypothetical protein MRK02_11850 [Candidatus Scalindua sp.]|nr:hypothetical protein [Candidatus Scalindua sp.]